jgi:secreted trypsin-like serine protease
MSRHILPLLGLVISLCALGACDHDEGGRVVVGRLEPRIINGTTDTTHTAVVALVTQGQQFCSGTLIAPRVVVSAGHCLKDTGLSASDITIFFGNTVGGSGTSVKVTKLQVHPSYYAKSDGTPMNDVSVLVLAQDAPVSPMAWQSTALSSIVGQSVLMVGYGVTSASKQTGNGTRRKVTQKITGQDSTFLYYGDAVSGTCQGDSGGPTFLDESGVLTLVAVTSYGDTSCVKLGANTRVDPYASFISSFITSCTPSCSGKQCGADGCGGTCGSCASSSTCNTSGQCVASTTSSCAHAICSTGAKLTATCDSCASKICASDNYCCTTAWDAQCVGEVASVCGQPCGASSDGGATSSCSHSQCSTGSKLKSGCNACVTSICSADSYCCANTWDAQCVAEVAQFCDTSC